MSFIRRLVSKGKKIITAEAAPSSNSLRVYFCHVPKCGGSSAAAALRNTVMKGASKGSFLIPAREREKVSEILSVSPARASEVYLSFHLADCHNIFGSGHGHCRPCVVKAFKEEWAFVTVLRNPIDRWISHYIYSTYKMHDWGRDNKLPIEEFLQSPRALGFGRKYLEYFSDYSEAPDSADLSHYMTQAIETLSCFRVVGALEMMPAWKDAVQAKLGMQIYLPFFNISPCPEEQKRIRSNRKLMGEIAELCQHDIKIYEQVLKDGTDCS